MRITDPRWPAVREAARLLLREENIVVQGPDWIEPELHALGVLMGDRLPSRLHFPSCLSDFDEPLAILRTSTLELLVQCNESEPPLGVVWIPLEARAAWEAIKATAIDLLEAGYPGCVGCAGKEAEQPWDEEANRKRLVKSDVLGP